MFAVVRCGVTRDQENDETATFESVLAVRPTKLEAVAVGRTLAEAAQAEECPDGGVDSFHSFGQSQNTDDNLEEFVVYEEKDEEGELATSILLFKIEKVHDVP